MEIKRQVAERASCLRIPVGRCWRWLWPAGWQPSRVPGEGPAAAFLRRGGSCPFPGTEPAVPAAGAWSPGRWQPHSLLPLSSADVLTPSEQPRVPGPSSLQGLRRVCFPTGASVFCLPCAPETRGPPLCGCVSRTLVVGHHSGWRSVKSSVITKGTVHVEWIRTPRGHPRMPPCSFP